MNNSLKNKFDSLEENLFYNWCLISEKKGLIKKFEYHTDRCCFDLIPQVIVHKYKYKRNELQVIPATLLNDMKYTCDFIITVSSQKMKDLKLKHSKYRKLIDCYEPELNADDEYELYIDTKGCFNKFQRNFSITRKVLFNMYKIYVNEVKIPNFFKFSFCPAIPEVYKKDHTVRKMYEKYIIKEL